MYDSLAQALAAVWRLPTKAWLVPAPGGEAPHLSHPPPSLAELSCDGPALRKRFAGASAVALQHPDPLHLLARLTALWREGLPVVLLPDESAPVINAAEAAGWSLWRAAETLPVAPSLAPPDFDAEALRIAFLSSGSSGERRAYWRRLAQLEHECRVHEAQWGDLARGRHVLGSVSPVHIYGFLMRLLWPLLSGRPLMVGSPTVAALLQASLQEPQRSILVSSPSVLEILASDARSAEAAGLLVISSGGELPEHLARRLARLCEGGAIELYGSTETAGVAWRRRTQEIDADDAAWTLLPGVHVQASPQGQPDAPAPFQIDSPFLADGLARPWQSADAGLLQEDGRFLLGGRLDLVVKLGERRFSLVQVEQAIRASGLAADVLVRPIQGGTHLQRSILGALIVPAADSAIPRTASARREFAQHLRRSLAAQGLDPLCHPRHLAFVQSLPRDPQSKLSAATAQALVENFCSRQLLPPAQLLPSQGPAVRIKLHCPQADTLWLRGHFPGIPVLPGVAQLHWARHLAQEYLGLTPQDWSGAMDQVKFQRLIRPGDEVLCELERQGDRVHFALRLHPSGELSSSGRLALYPGTTGTRGKP